MEASSRRPICPGTVVHFEMRRKDKAVSLRLPEKLLEAVRVETKREGVHLPAIRRMAIESALAAPQCGPTRLLAKPVPRKCAQAALPFSSARFAAARWS
jgi:hypothetical protein